MRIANRTCRWLLDYTMRSALIVAAVVSIGEIAAAGTITYAYDEMGRLKQVIHEDGRQTTYTLDAAGNRTAFTTTPPPGFLQFSSASYSVAENQGSLTITVARVGGSYGAASVQYSTSDATATAGSDYTATSGTLSWTDGDPANKTFVVSILDDATVESNETLNLTLTGVTGANLGTPSAATLTITDYEPGTLQLSPATYTIAENGGSATITVTRANGSSGAVSVNYATSTGTATSGTDFTAASGTLSWITGDSAAKTFSVPITDDSTVEPSETISLALSAPTGGATLGTSSGTITITDYEPGQLQFSPTAYSVTEAATTVTVSVTRTSGSDGAVGVSYSASADTAVSPSDFTATSGSLSWANGDAAPKSFAVTIADDSTGETTETINLALSSPTGGATLGTSSGTITINDNETGTLQFSAASYSVAEAGVSVTITVTRVNGSYGAASVNYATANGTATAGSDFTTSSGTLNWAAGDPASKTFTVPITSDSIYESTGETFTVSLSGATGSALGTPTSATVTITDDDPAQPGTLALNPAVYSVLEANTTVTVTVTRTGGSDLPVSVQYATSAGTATAGTDYADTSGTLNWSHGDSTPKSFAVTIVDNNTGEPDETINVTLSSVAGGATLGTSSGTITINDNEPGHLRLSPSSYTVGEAGGSVTITAVRDNGTYGAVSATYGTANGTAVAGSDFTAATGTVDWANGDALSKTFSVSIIDDAVVDPSESFDLTLTNPTGGATVQFPPVGSVTITDNESTVPSTPANLRPGGIRTSVPYTMMWDASTGPLSYYELWADDGGTTIYTINAPTTSKSVSSNNGITVDYRVRACNSSNQCSPWSAVPVAVTYCEGGSCQ